MGDPIQVDFEARAIANKAMEKLDSHSERIVKLEHWKTGNGAKGAEDRLQVLEAYKESLSPLYTRLETHLEEHKDNSKMIKSIIGGIIIVVLGQIALVVLGMAAISGGVL